MQPDSKMRHRLPFQSLTPRSWANLALAAVAFFYVAQVVFDLWQNNMCGHLAIDYCAFWSAGTVANAQGYAAVYDLQSMETAQKLVFPRRYEVSGFFATVPTPYLPVFIVPFAMLSPLGPFAGYWLWTAANLALFIWYVRFFIRKTSDGDGHSYLVTLLLLSFPVFLNFFYGQVNVLLAICIGEYLRASLARQPLRAGLWLACLLIKPQYLILLGVALILQRAIRTLAGLAIGSAAVLVSSFALIGPGGFEVIRDLWIRYALGLPATGPNVMMNWRMLGLFLEAVLRAPLAWPLIYLAMTISAVGGLLLWRRPAKTNALEFPTQILGLLAATAAVAWHSHISSAALLICPLALLYIRHPGFPKSALFHWALLPAAFQLLVLVLAGISGTRVWAGGFADVLNFLSAVVPFGFNLYFLIWALRQTGNLGSVPTHGTPA